MMPAEPGIKRTIAFIDGQNLFHAAREVFGATYPDFDLALPDGTSVTVPVGQEKGIDVRIALDIVRLAASDAYDVALVFSQDQDLAEAAQEMRDISVSTGRWIKVAWAYPWAPPARKQRGINNTEWIKIGAVVYAAATDLRDYRAPRTAPPQPDGQAPRSHSPLVTRDTNSSTVNQFRLWSCGRSEDLRGLSRS